MKKDHFNQLKELHEDKKALALYNHYVLNELANLHPINLGCVVTKNYILDFLIFYFSVVESWTFYPYLVHVFTFEKKTNDRIQSFNLPNVKIHLMNMNLESNWSNFTAIKIKMVEWSGLERCIISDVDNIFLAETPELNFLLDKNDFVFIGAPHSEWILQTSLWSFRRNRHTLKFARKWFKESLGRPHSDASGLPFAIYKSRRSGLKVKALVIAKDQKHHHKCPYDVQANIRPFILSHDELGFSEAEMGRAKVYHFGGLRPVNNETIDERMSRLNTQFPQSKPIFGLYRKLASMAFHVLENKC